MGYSRMQSKPRTCDGFKTSMQFQTRFIGFRLAKIDLQTIHVQGDKPGWSSIIAFSIRNNKKHC